MNTNHFESLMVDPEMSTRLISRTTQILRIVSNAGTQTIVDIINASMAEGDEHVIAALKTLRKPRSTPTNNKWLVNRGTKRARDIDRLFQTNDLVQIKNKAQNLLDIGAGDCYNTVGIGTKSMGLTGKDLYAVDIPLWGENKHNKPDDFDINFKFIDPDTMTLPFQVSFNRIIALQSLHHIPNIPNIMYEMNRVAAPGAIVIIREHDCQCPLMSSLIDIEHILYDTVVGDIEYADFAKTYYGKYRSKYQWTQIFESHMFQLIKTKPVIAPGDTNYYYAVYQKIGNAKPFSKYSVEVLQLIYEKVAQAQVNKKWKKAEIINEIWNII